MTGLPSVRDVVFLTAVGRGRASWELLWREKTKKKALQLDNKHRCMSWIACNSVILRRGDGTLTLFCSEDEGLGGSVRERRSQALLSCTAKRSWKQKHYQQLLLEKTRRKCLENRWPGHNSARWAHFEEAAEESLRPEADSKGGGLKWCSMQHQGALQIPEESALM